MYIVRFVRKDKKPAEEYYYQWIEDAYKHIYLFKDDDLGQYEKIEIARLS